MWLCHLQSAIVRLLSYRLLWMCKMINIDAKGILPLHPTSQFTQHSATYDSLSFTPETRVWNQNRISKISSQRYGDEPKGMQKQKDPRGKPTGNLSHFWKQKRFNIALQMIIDQKLPFALADYGPKALRIRHARIKGRRWCSESCCKHQTKNDQEEQPLHLRWLLGMRKVKVLSWHVFVIASNNDSTLPFR